MTVESVPARAVEILDFWIGDADRAPQLARARSETWFGGGAELDREIAARFGDLLEPAARPRLESWKDSTAGLLASIILFDQFTRNVHRGSASAFAHDSMALGLSLALQDSEAFAALGPVSRVFALMPMQHSEDLEIQERSVHEFERQARGADAEWRPMLEDNAKYAALHRDIVRRFGRFPHRNAALGRESTEEERAWLAAGAPTFGQ